MLLDKLPWVEHEGAIYSVHAQPHGARFATGGFDAKVKIWNLAAALDATVEAQPDTPKLLATLGEHTAVVNVVRFSPDGKLLASGSDDKAVVIYQLAAGAGGAVLGSTTPNVENWRPKLLLRGHDSNITDLAWSHDSAKLATASLDSKVMVWDAASGHRIATLTAQESFVKGVQWDPVGSYLASQSDDHSVVIYQTSDWSVLACIDKPYQRMITDTFATRLGFSPDGAWLLTGNSFQRGNHCAVLVPRGKWDEGGEYLFIAGHTGAVVSTVFNPKMFHLPAAGGPIRNGKGETFSDALTCVFATGDINRRVVVWTSGAGRPLFAGKAFFKQGVTDLSWTSDGYALLACSGDGTVGLFQFTEGELGQAGSGEEMEEVMKGLYGNRQRGVGGRLLFAESIDQLEEEVPAPQQQQQQQQKVAKAVPQRQPLAEAPPAPSNRPLPAPAPGAKPANGGLDALTARLEGRMGMGGAGETQVGFGNPPASQQAPSAARPAPVKGGDGRKRIVPESTAGAGSAPVGSMAPPPPRQPAAAGGGGAALPAAKRQRAEKGGAASGRTAQQAAAAAPSGAQAAGSAPAAAAAAAEAQPPPVAGAWGAPLLLAAPTVKPEWSVRFRGEPPPAEEDGQAGAAAQPRELRILNRDRGPTGRPQAELACVRGQESLWSDVAAGVAVCACGTPNFAAVGLQDGSVLLYSPAGRRLGGPFKLGAGLARMACDSAWLLLAITTSGRVKLVHVGQQRTLLSTTVAPLVEDGAQVVDAQLSRQGWPMLTLSSHRAYLFHPGLEEWMCVAEEAYAGSPFLPTMRLQNQGELTGLQAEVLVGSYAAQPRALLASKPAQQQQSRALLEGNLAAALCLRSPQEYRRWLAAYAQLLAETGDEGRLRELCMDLMGPALGPAATAQQQQQEPGGGGGDVAMADAEKAGPSSGSGTAGAAGAAAGGWEPAVLGLDKREDLLEGEVLRVVSRSRVLGGLAGEMRDILEDARRLD